MKKSIIVLLMLGMLSSYALAQTDEYWAREFMPSPNLAITFSGVGDDGNVLEFTTIYYARERAASAPDYWLSEYNIFPGDIQDADFVPRVSVDYFVNEQGLWTLSPFEKSMGLPPSLLLPYKFHEGMSFKGKDGMEYTFVQIGQNVQENGKTYESCLELSNELGDQIFFMPELGVVLSRGNDERWMVRYEFLNNKTIQEKFHIR